MRFPIWQYLQQPVFDRTQDLILNPLKFRQAHAVSYLERCWLRTYKPEKRFNS